jgi:hypothetical protein
MTVYSFQVGPYARNIYLYGTRSFSGHNGTNSIPLEYHEPVKQYAADNFTRGQIDEALVKNFVTQQEYDDTVAKITKEVVLPTSAPAN